MIILTDQNFEEEVLKSKIPVLVDFWAPWCGPCQMLKPIIEELEGEEGIRGKIKIGELDVDKNQKMAEKYGIMSIPAILIINKGQVVKMLVGSQTKEALIEEIKKLEIK